MLRFLTHSLAGVAVSIFSAPFAIGAQAQEVARRVEPLKAAPAQVPGAKRKVPKLVIDPKDRVVLLKALAEAARDAEGMPDPQQRINALSNMACGQFLAGDVAAARATLKQANEANAQLPRQTIKAISFLGMAKDLGEYGDKEGALAAVASAAKLAKTLDPVNPVDQINIAREIARAEAMIGEDVGAKAALEGAIEALTTMSDENQWNQCLILTVDGLLEVGQYDRVLDISEAIPDIRLDLKTRQLNQVVGKMSKTTPATAKTVLARSIAIALAIKDDRVKSDALSKIAAAQAETGDIAGAIAIARPVGEGVRSPVSVVLNPTVQVAIASAQVRAGDLAKAKTSFAEAIRLAKSIAPEDSEYRAQGLRSAAAAQAKAGFFADALKTVEQIEKDDFHKSLAFSEIGSAQVSARDNVAAAESFRRAFELAKAIDEQPEGRRGNVHIKQQQAFYEAACGLAATRNFDEAVKDAKFAVSLDPNRQTYHSLYALSQIAGERAWAGDIDGALKAAGEIEDEWNRYNAYERVAKLEGEAGGEADACSWISQLEDPQIRLRLMWSVVKGLAKRSSNLRTDLPDLSKLKKRDSHIIKDAQKGAAG